MFNVIHIKLENNIIRDSQKFDSLITVESIRDFILNICDNEPDTIRDIINHKEHTLPKILYSRPYKNMVRIFSLGEEGRMALNSIFVNLMRVGYIKIKNKRYKLKGSPIIETDIATLPVCDGATYTYTTLTPLMVFNKKNHKVLHALAGKHFEQGAYYEKGTPEQQEAFKKDLIEFTNQQIKDGIKYLLSSIIPGKSKEEFEFVESIEIEWEDIRVIFTKYHTEEKGIPMVTGRFKTNFSMPKFLGYKIGKGFGELSLKKRVGGAVA